MQHWERSAEEISKLVRSKAVSAAEVTEAVLQRLEQVNPLINAVVQDCSREARETATAIDQRIAAGDDPGPLAGVPITTKVNVDQAGYATTNGVRIQERLMAERDNPVVANLKRAGAVIVGRTNTPAFSLRWFCRNDLHGWTRNPHDPSITPGGSSGGAAAGLAAGIGAIAHGTDIGGSVRYPAYACGLHGLRPTLGRIPAFNFTGGDRLIGGQLMAVSGPLTRTIEDLRLAFTAMCAPDPDDPWWMPVPLELGDFPRRAALCVSPKGMAVDEPVQRELRSAADKLQEAGWQVDEVEPPSFEEPARLQATLWLAEFRRSNKEALVREGNADALFVFGEMEKLSPETDLNGFMDTLKERSRWVRIWTGFLHRYPVLICPVSGELPFPDQLDVSSPEAFRRVMRAQLTQLGLPVLGLPGLTVSTGKVGPVPVGVQLIGPRYREDILFRAGQAIADRSEPCAVVTPQA